MKFILFLFNILMFCGCANMTQLAMNMEEHVYDIDLKRQYDSSQQVGLTERLMGWIFHPSGLNEAYKQTRFEFGTNLQNKKILVANVEEGAQLKLANGGSAPVSVICDKTFIHALQRFSIRAKDVGGDIVNIKNPLPPGKKTLYEARKLDEKTVYHCYLDRRSATVYVFLNGDIVEK